MDENTLNDLLECSVCLERLDTTSKVLPCQHTFCRKCLEEIVISHKELRCPECRMLSSVKIDDLPPNVLLMRILEGLKTNTQPQQSQTELLNLPKPLVPIKTQSQLDNQPTPLIANSSQDTNQIDRTSNGLNSVVSPVSKLLFPAPHAKAMYDFISQEPSDLSFKKGDLIILKRRIDQNWLFGECNGREGTFPLNHVLVIVPLPLPQCRALYDFKMGPQDEEGCLSFIKGTIIHVLRRIDVNWAEGRIGNCIGIFPISFVEMNSLAKHLMNISPKCTTSTRNVPPIPFYSAASSDSSSSMTTPNSASVSSSTTSTASNSPTNNSVAKPLISKPLQNSDKRHSVTLISSTTETPNQRQSNCNNRRSMEVPNIHIPTSSTNKQSNNPTRNGQRKHEKRSSQNKQPSSPRPYVAMYPYKPLHQDELELRVGEVYLITEKAEEGWFKGVNRLQKRGLLPANYVMPYKSGGHQENHRNRRDRISNTHSTNNIPGTSKNMNSNQPPQLPSRSKFAPKPLSHRVESLFKKSVENGQVKLSLKDQLNTTVNKDKDKDEGNSSNPQSNVSLMKILTKMKRSKSPSYADEHNSYSMDNPVFEDTAPLYPQAKQHGSLLAVQQSAQTVHVRSGSCPSQLLENLSADKSNKVTEPVNTTAYLFNSQRIKGSKERPQIPGIPRRAEHEASSDSNGFKAGHSSNSKNKDNTSLHSQYVHRKSHSVDATGLPAQINEISINNISKSKTPSGKTERFRCIVPYPPNSEYELELKVGDIVYVNRKRDNGWYKGVHSATGKTGLFPASFVEADI